MNNLIKFILIFLISLSVEARDKGETEIITEDGIEVYQTEKFYLLKKNVRIVSDNFNLNADNVKIIFKESLYDIVEINANGNVIFESFEFNLKGNSKILNFKIKEEELDLMGIGSELIMEDVIMISDGIIKVSNLSGNFSLKGLNSELKNENILIKGENIEGTFSNNKSQKEISYLNVLDNDISYVKNNNTEMYAEKIIFDEDKSLIELIEKVTIIRDGEEISGDYGTLDTKDNSYKIKSTKNKVKVVIKNNEQ